MKKERSKKGVIWMWIFFLFLMIGCILGYITVSRIIDRMESNAYPTTDVILPGY